MLLSYVNYIFAHLRQKRTSQAQIKPEILVKFRPAPGPNPNRKDRPDLQLWIGKTTLIGIASFLDYVNNLFVYGLQYSIFENEVLLDRLGASQNCCIL